MNKLYFTIILLLSFASGIWSQDTTNVIEVEKIEEANEFQEFLNLETALEQIEDEVQNIDYEAEGDYSFESRKYKEAILYYDMAINENNINDYTFYLRALSKLYTSDYAGAIADFTKAIDMFPSDISRLWSYNSRSLKIGDGYTTSIQGMSLKHKYYHAYFYRAQSKFQLMDYRGAIADYDKVLLIDKEMALSYNMRGFCKYNLDNFQGAIQDFTKFISLNPKDGEVFFYRGVSYLELNQKEQGCKDLSRAGELGEPNAYDLIKKYCN